MTPDAALLVADDCLPDREIAAAVGVCERTIRAWKKAPEFAARVEEHLTAYRAQLARESLARLVSGRFRPSGSRRS